MFLVVDCEFNQAWYKDLIGQVLAQPPAYAVVRRIT